MANFTPSTTANSRVFLVEGQARADHAASYESCLKMMGVDYALGDIEKIECPDPNRYGQFIEIGQIRGAETRPTSSLVGRYALDLASQLLRLAKKRCSSDVQVHLGSCSDPSDFNTFDKVIILEGVAITNYSTEDLGALSSDENQKTDETADISAAIIYEFLPMGYASRAGDVVTNEVVDVTICDSASCGDCDDESDGCSKIYAVTVAAGGSPGTPPDVVYSIDKGVTWYAHDIDTLATTQGASGVACVGVNLVVVSNDAGSLNYAPLADFKAGTGDPVFTEITTGFVALGEPNDIWSTGLFAFIVGDAGYIYTSSDPTDKVTVVDAGVAVQDNLNAVHAISDTFAVAVGNAGSIVKTENGSIWSEITTTPVGVGVNLQAVFVVDETNWWIGGDNGNLYYTLDAGVTWTIKTFPNSAAGTVFDIQFPTQSVGYLAHQTSGTKGNILETLDGGNTWTVAPRGTDSIPASDKINAVASCNVDPNFVVGVGLADNASDGVVIVGEG